MQKIIVRKEISLRGIAQVVVLLFLIPFIGYQITSIVTLMNNTNNARNYYEKKQFDLALTSANEVLEKVPHHRAALEIKSLVLLDKIEIKLDQSIYYSLTFTIQKLRAYHKKSASYADLVEAIVWAKCGKPYYAHAIAMFENSLSSRYTFSPALKERAITILYNICRDNGDYAKALYWLDEIKRKNSSDIYYLSEKASLLVSLGEVSQGKDTLRQLIINNDWSEEMIVHGDKLIEILASLKLTEEQDFFSQLLLEKSAYHPYVAKKYGMYLYFEKRKAREARKIWSESLTRYPDAKEISMCLKKFK